VFEPNRNQWKWRDSGQWNFLHNEVIPGRKAEFKRLFPIREAPSSEIVAFQICGWCSSSSAALGQRESKQGDAKSEISLQATGRTMRLGGLLKPQKI
jgi:hypothetical protein